jgi:hypothetical protein
VQHTTDSKQPHDVHTERKSQSYHAQATLVSGRAGGGEGGVGGPKQVVARAPPAIAIEMTASVTHVLF